MGTRNLTMVIKDGSPKIAQYGQWDGYPEGQGLTALRILRQTNPQELEKALGKCVLYENYEEMPDKSFDDRNFGAGILGEVLKSELSQINLYNESSFAKDSLFCEWAYVIDLDKGTFEVYKGFNQSPLSENERFFSLQESQEEEYYPVRHVATFSLESLPEEQEFLEKAKALD